MRRQKVKAGDRWVYVSAREAEDNTMFKLLGVLPNGPFMYQCINPDCQTLLGAGYYNIRHCNVEKDTWHGECVCPKCVSPSIKQAAIDVTEYLRQEGAI